MLNQVNEELNKLIQRLEMLFQIQTHEVVQDLKKIRELLNNPEEIQAPKTPKVNKEEIKKMQFTFSALIRNQFTIWL